MATESDATLDHPAVNVRPGTPSGTVSLAAVTITPTKTEYVVVIDKDGKAWPNYPILTFEIDGPPLLNCDIQVSTDPNRLVRGFETPLFATGYPVPGSWNPLSPTSWRVRQPMFSSFGCDYPDGSPIQLDGTGKATFEMPLEWWRDQARHGMSRKVYYRVVGRRGNRAISYWSTGDGATHPSVLLNSNVMTFAATRGEYVAGGSAYKYRVMLHTREPDTVPMYAFVQLLLGYRWECTGTPPKADYFTIPCSWGEKDVPDNFTQWVVDTGACQKNPRYLVSGKGKMVFASQKTSPTDPDMYMDDAPGWSGLATPSVAGFNTAYFRMDFRSRLYLNCDVPDEVTVTKVGDEVRGTISDDLAAVAEKEWKVRIFLSKKVGADEFEVSHPDDHPRVCR